MWGGGVSRYPVRGGGGKPAPGPAHSQHPRFVVAEIWADWVAQWRGLTFGLMSSAFMPSERQARRACLITGGVLREVSCKCVCLRPKGILCMPKDNALVMTKGWGFRNEVRNPHTFHSKEVESGAVPFVTHPGMVAAAHVRLSQLFLQGSQTPPGHY